MTRYSIHMLAGWVALLSASPVWAAGEHAEASFLVVISGANTVYTNGGYNEVETAGDIIAPSPGRYSGMQVYCYNALGAGITGTFTLRKNGAAGASTCQISGASALTCNDPSHSDDFTTGDRLGVEVDITGGSAATAACAIAFKLTANGSSSTARAMQWLAAGSTAANQRMDDNDFCLYGNITLTTASGGWGVNCSESSSAAAAMPIPHAATLTAIGFGLSSSDSESDETLTVTHNGSDSGLTVDLLAGETAATNTCGSNCSVTQGGTVRIRGNLSNSASGTASRVRQVVIEATDTGQWVMVGQIPFGTSTLYAVPQYWTGSSTAQHPIASDGVLKNLYARASVAPSSAPGSGVTFTIATGTCGTQPLGASEVTCTITPSLTSCNSGATSVSVTAGQCYQVTITSTGEADQTDWLAFGFEMAPVPGANTPTPTQTHTPTSTPTVTNTAACVTPCGGGQACVYPTPTP